MDAAYGGNPSSSHAEGRAARDALEGARRRVAEALGTSPDTIYFTSGATESNAIVLFSVLFAHADGIRQAVMTTAAEHPSITNNCASLSRLGVPTHILKVAATGAPEAAALEKALHRHTDTTLLALMAVNNETGAVSDIRALAEAAREGGKLKGGKPLRVHSDMAQALGKVPLPPLSELNIDSASFSAHKIGGPRGIGVLYLRKPVSALYRGGGQERGVRPGTENTAGALAFARAIEERACGQAVRDAHAEARGKMGALIRGFRAIEGCAIIPECRAEDDGRYSPYILQAAFRGVAGEVMARALDDAGFAVSTGSACSSASKERPVLAAMGVSPAFAFTAIRVSIGPDTTLADIAALAAAASELAAQLAISN